MTRTYSQTYLYKLHHLTLVLDKFFNHVLLRHSGVSLSQFLVLLAIAQTPGANQNHIAKTLNISRAAVNRQIGILVRNKWLVVKTDPHNRRQQVLMPTALGQRQIKAGAAALEAHAFKIFESHNRQMGLMQHLDELLNSTKGALQQQKSSPNKISHKE